MRLWTRTALGWAVRSCLPPHTVAQPFLAPSAHEDQLNIAKPCVSSSFPSGSGIFTLASRLTYRTTTWQSAAPPTGPKAQFASSHIHLGGFRCGNLGAKRLLIALGGLIEAPKGLGEPDIHAIALVDGHSHHLALGSVTRQAPPSPWLASGSGRSSPTLRPHIRLHPFFVASGGDDILANHVHLAFAAQPSLAAFSQLSTQMDFTWRPLFIYDHRGLLGHLDGGVAAVQDHHQLSHVHLSAT